VLRLVYLKHRYQLGYESLCREVTDSISWRQFRPIPLDWPDNDHWTLDRVATVIERLTGSAIIAVTCGSCCATGCIIACCVLPAAPSSVTSGPSPAGWSRTGPRIRSNARRRRAGIVFWDESGASLLPVVRRTWAPRGRTPILDAWDRRDRISAISCITVSPRTRRLHLYFELLPDNRTAHAEEVVAFLEKLRRQLRGPFTVVWDRHKIHSKSKAVQAWLARHPDVRVEDFPPHDPQDDPDEWVWSWAKYGKRCNFCPADVDTLFAAVLDALDELKHRPCVLASFVMAAGVPLCL
jgi:hypothetical protein